MHGAGRPGPHRVEKCVHGQRVGEGVCRNWCRKSVMSGVERRSEKREKRGKQAEKDCRGRLVPCCLFCRFAVLSRGRRKTYEDVEKERTIQSAHSDIFSGPRSSPLPRELDGRSALGQSDVDLLYNSGALFTVQVMSTSTHDSTDDCCFHCSEHQSFIFSCF